MAGMGFFKRLVSGLTKTRENIVSNMDEIFMSYDEINEEFFQEIEEILIIGDIGVATAKSIMDEFRFEIKQFGLTKPMETKKLLIDSIKYQMRMYNNDYDFENKKSVILVIGVNGVGKTTSIGKLANQYKNNGKKVIITVWAIMKHGEVRIGDYAARSASAAVRSAARFKRRFLNTQSDSAAENQTANSASEYFANSLIPKSHRYIVSGSTKYTAAVITINIKYANRFER